MMMILKNKEVMELLCSALYQNTYQDVIWRFIMMLPVFIVGILIDLFVECLNIIFSIIHYVVIYLTYSDSI